MTDEELKELVGSLAIAQKKTDEQIAELFIFQKEVGIQMKHTDEQMKHTDEQMKSTIEQLKRTDEQLKRTDEQLKRTDEKLERTDEQLKRTDEKLERTDEKLERIGVQLGNIAGNQGDVAEEFFFNSLANDTHLGSICFDDISKNENKRRGRTEEEYDIVMTNGNSIGIVEVKYKAHENDLEKLERKMRNFKKLFPVYENYKLYGAIASFHIYKKAKHAALERGFFVLQRSGEVIQTDCAENLLVL